MSYIKTQDNVKLYVKDWGEGRPVIMLHGWPLSSDSFDDLSMAVAAAGMRAIAYDRRGFGRSDQPWSGYDYDTLSDDLAAVMEQTGAQDATLLGFSMGGGEVARYMSRHGGAGVRQAILAASVVPFMLKTEDNPLGTDADTFESMTREIKTDRAKILDGLLQAVLWCRHGLASGERGDLGVGRRAWAWRRASRPHSIAPAHSPPRISARTCRISRCPR